MNVYLLWFNEWEANYVLGVFETKERAEKWKSYFIANPLDRGYIAPDMKHFADRGSSSGDEWTKRFHIQECIIDRLVPEIKVDNLKYVEHLFTESENASKIDGTEPSCG